jgi:membrane-associated phospholipid phosphatase
MEVLTQFFLPVSIFFQDTPSWVITIFKGITFLGNTEFYLIIMPALFWSIDATLGIRTGIMLLVGGGLNSIFKFAFQWPRPFWVTSQVTNLAEGTSFGFPSGHAQNAASIWGLIGTETNKKWIKWFVVLIIFLIGFSRILLGVHFTHDVLVGWLVGGFLLWIFLKLEKPVVGWFKTKTLPVQILALIITTSLLLIPAILIVPPFNPPAVPQVWIEGAGEVIEPYHYEGLLTTAGSFFGLGLGVILLSRGKGFNAQGPVWQRVLRYLLGLIGVLVLYLGLGSIFPDNIDMISYSLRFFRYFLIGFWIAFGAPKLFGWLKLSGGTPA